MRRRGIMDEKETIIIMALKPLSFAILRLVPFLYTYPSTVSCLMMYFPMMFMVIVTKNRSKPISMSEER